MCFKVDFGGTLAPWNELDLVYLDMLSVASMIPRVEVLLA